jgi:hypothetical protein
MSKRQPRVGAPARQSRASTEARLEGSADYIGQMSQELAQLARADGCVALSHLLDLASSLAKTGAELPERHKLI